VPSSLLCTKKGFTGKDIAASKIAPKSTIYRLIKNFKESASIVVKKASGHPRKSSKRQNRLLKLIRLLRDRDTTSTELTQEWQQAGVSASACTVRRRLLEDGLMFGASGKKLVRRRQGERYHQSCVMPTVKRPETIHVWGCFSAKGEGSLTILLIHPPRATSPNHPGMPFPA
jgi:transposase